jgi:hypothetical protein
MEETFTRFELLLCKDGHSNQNALSLVYFNA